MLVGKQNTVLFFSPFATARTAFLHSLPSIVLNPIGVVAGALLLMLQSNVNATQQEPGAPLPPANLITVEASQFGSSVTLGGTVVAYKQVTLTAQLPGRIEFIAGTEGDSFSDQDVLVTIDDDDLLAKRRAALAQIGNAQSAIANAQMQYSRELYSPGSRSIARSGGMGMPMMFDQMFTRPMQGFMPGNAGGEPWLDRQADLYSSGTQVNQAHSAQLSAQAQLEQIDAGLRDARSFAPFAGVIIRKMVEQGDTVQPGQPLLEFADLEYLQVQVEVPSRLMPVLEKGMLVPAKLDIGDTHIQVRVAQIFPSADAQRHTVTVKFDLPVGVPGGPGMYAEVMLPDITASQEPVPVIPDTAVMWRGSLPAVYVVNSENKSQLRLIRLGDYVGSNQVAVLSGLQVGERIYAVPPAKLASGWASGR